MALIFKDISVDIWPRVDRKWSQTYIFKHLSTANDGKIGNSWKKSAPISSLRKPVTDVKSSHCPPGGHAPCFQSFTPIHVSGLSEDQPWGPQGQGGFTTWMIDDCSMWQKWPSYYLYGNSLNGEKHTTLAAAQQSCYQHGPLCNAVKRKRGNYYLMQSQDIPSKKSGSWADYWVKLAATN